MMPGNARISAFSSAPIPGKQGANLLTLSRGLRWMIVGVALIFLPMASALSQANFASVSGEVFDVQKAVIPGAKVTLQSSSTGLSRSTVCNGDGFYAFTAVNPGEYVLRVDAPGFQSQLRRFVLAVNQALRLD